MKHVQMLILSLSLIMSFTFAQIPSNIFVTNAEADLILKGNYDPANYSATQVIDDLDQIVCEVMSNISTDSLHSYLIKLGTFYNRNSGSDTLSTTTGIGAARRWAYNKFRGFSAASEDRLITSYLQFDQVICGMSQHRNIFTILPGSDTLDKSVLILEAHIDSRCEDGCDITCQAHGIEDNASGSALVLELARVMSQFTFKHSIVFMLTIAEEQGLYGANAFSQYCVDNNILINAVQNNDVIGGITCGNTSSPPSCPSENHIDSTHVRIFSATGASRGYAQYVKHLFEQKLQPIMDVWMDIEIMNQEDRTGRGGDHIPFRQDGYTAIRFCSANEHGDAGVSDPNYTDRQHTTSDILGIDTDLDGEIDSFFVDFNYLKRNAVINAFGATMIALMPPAPDFQGTTSTSDFSVEITSQTQHPKYTVAVRLSSNNDVNNDTTYSFTGSLTYSVPNISS
ncbi:MAG: hypothetical protein COB85_09310, partial [Bacteroidetes bacterium]